MGGAELSVGCTQLARSKIRKASAFCWGESSAEQLGKTSLPESPLPEAKCTSVNTMRPQAGPPTGVGKPSYSAAFSDASSSSSEELLEALLATPLPESVVIQETALGSMVPTTVRSLSLIEISP